MDASTFPIPFKFHLIFCIVAAIFFLLQFIRLKRPYQLILTIAIPASLLIYVGDPSDKSWFHMVGWAEAILLLGAMIVSMIARFRRRDPEVVSEQTVVSEPAATCRICRRNC